MTGFSLSRPVLLKSRAQDCLQNILPTIFILTEKTQNLYAHMKEAEDGFTNSSSRMIDLRTEEGDGRGHKA